MNKQKTKVEKWLKEENPILYYLSISLNYLNTDNNKNLRDLGKLLAEPNEYIQKDWINKNTKLRVYRRNDNDLNASGYDLIDSNGILRIQSKLRAKVLHLEQTRRKSKKNENSSSTGHVQYSVGEADIYMFSRPNIDDYINLKQWEYIVIPERYLIDKNNSRLIVPRVNKCIWKNFIGRAVEILEEEFDRLKEEYEKK